MSHCTFKPILSAKLGMKYSRMSFPWIFLYFEIQQELEGLNLKESLCFYVESSLKCEIVETWKDERFGVLIFTFALNKSQMTWSSAALIL